MTTAQNYVLGRGKLYFGQFAAGTQTPLGERDFGNTPDFKFSIKTSMLDHYSSQGGIKEKDDSITLEVDRSGAITVDNITPENLALFFLGSTDTLTTVAAVNGDETFVDAQQGMYYQLGVSAACPQGVREVSTVVVKVGVATKTIATDYTGDTALGRVYIVPGGGIANLDDVQVTYHVSATTRSRVISSNTPIEGALRFVAVNPKGVNRDYFMPWVKITPNGDYSLIGDTWQQITFDIEILTKTGLAAVYADGRALVTP
jgi:hypothetical protein